MSAWHTPAPNMSAQDYSKYLIEGNISKCRPITFFKNNGTYIWCPNVPASPADMKKTGQSDTEISEVWNKFVEKLKRRTLNEWYHFTFHGDDKSFWHNRGKHVVVIGNKYCVCPSSMIV